MIWNNRDLNEDTGRSETLLKVGLTTISEHYGVWLAAPDHPPANTLGHRRRCLTLRRSWRPRRRSRIVSYTLGTRVQTPNRPLPTALSRPWMTGVGSRVGRSDGIAEARKNAFRSRCNVNNAKRSPELTLLPSSSASSARLAACASSRRWKSRALLWPLGTGSAPSWLWDPWRRAPPCAPLRLPRPRPRAGASSGPPRGMSAAGERGGEGVARSGSAHSLGVARSGSANWA